MPMTRAEEKPPAGAGEAGGAAPPSTPGTARDRAKADRRASLLAAAARLFAERGFDGVTLGDIGEAAGVSGPAVYRHVSSKQALLGAILVDVSERLLAGGRAVAAQSAAGVPGDAPPRDLPGGERFVIRAPASSAALRPLVDFHVAFALAEADVIRVQDRDLDRLSPDDRRTVRELQNSYVAVWTAALAAVDPDAETPAERRVRALACFGLINSTPHSVRGVPASRVRLTLTRMALAALTA
ncbi:TetR family transcriptional regulator [Microbacterium sp. PRF11]|uniref:TetR/AcrR family transcriptional regulator n=1 Tax=Microbacterium sp. PRF11 TaxID=2962593 RepID=UPI00288229E8|nr:TetR family transcriptional regulator [Microbacterium sp. PRF11]MDT0118212.1 TetR family transcriptional regulator [Microbacterium sp. PRF11]